MSRGYGHQSAALNALAGQRRRYKRFPNKFPSAGADVTDSAARVIFPNGDISPATTNGSIYMWQRYIGSLFHIWIYEIANDNGIFFFFWYIKHSLRICGCFPMDRGFCKGELESFFFGIYRNGKCVINYLNWFYYSFGKKSDIAYKGFIPFSLVITSIFY